MKTIEGKTAIITGAAGGIGTEIALLMERLGARLALVDIDRKRLDGLSKKLSSPAQTILCDITDLKQVKKAVSAAVRKHGAIDILVNNAGIIVPGLFENSAPGDIRRQVEINLMGAVNFTREVIPAMKASGGGHIVTVSSLAGIVPETYSAVYTATKFALRGLGLTLHLELKRHNIGVTTVFPDSVDTPMLKMEALHGGSPLTFLSPAQAPAVVARAVVKGIVKDRIEMYCPHSQGLLSKLVLCWPWAISKVWPLLEQSGEKNKRKFLEKMEKGARHG